MLQNHPVLLVSGANGHLGRRVVEFLLEAGVPNIIAASRTPEKLADFAARGVETRAIDFDDTDLLATALAGVDRFLLISTDVMDVPGKRVQQHLRAVRAAQEAGVSHVIYTSLVNPGPESPIVIASDHYATEQALAESGMGYTVLRNNIYADMLPASVERALQLGAIYNASADGSVSYVTREDCAAAAAAALASSFEGRRILDITGPEPVSQHDLAALASEFSGKQIAYVPVAIEQVVEGMVGAGLPRALAESYASFDAGTATGTMGVVSNDFTELTGRKPASVREFLSTVIEPVAPAA